VHLKTFCAVAVLAAAVIHPASAAPDWSKVQPKKIMLFYPAQVAWDRLMVPGRHSGRNKFIAGKNCFGCHGNIDEHPLGDSLVHGEKDIEPEPIAGKPGAVDLQVKTAHDAENLYVQISFDPGQQPDAGMDKDFETKLTMMLDDGGVAEMTRAGCWSVCHDDVAKMAHGNDDTTKYIFDSRMIAPGGGGIVVKPPEELAKMKSEGHFLEYWQARLKTGAKPVAVDGYVLDKRVENKTPEVQVAATQNKGLWTVTFTRKLKGAADHKDLSPGKTYTLGFALHAGHTAKRFHYVSFERTLTLDDGTADFVAANPASPAH
jgi:cytochrome c-type protein NapC